MIVDVVKETNSGENLSEFTLKTTGEVSDDVNKYFIKIKIYEYFQNRLKNSPYSKEKQMSILKDIEECIPEDSYKFFEDSNYKSIDVLVRFIYMKA